MNAPVTGLSGEEYHRILEAAADDFVALVAAEDLTTPVPTCPGWNLLELGRHLGSVHRWAADCIVSGAPADETDGPTDRVELVDWMREGADALLDLLRHSDPQAPTWTFGPPPRTVSFWSRRQAHETTLHLWDATNALGRSDRIDPRLAADGVDEVVTMFFPRQVRLGRIPSLSVGVRFVLDDDAGDGYVLAGDGTDPGATAVATVSGSAPDVLLALWGRSALERLTIDGDPDVVREVLSAGIVP